MILKAVEAEHPRSRYLVTAATRALVHARRLGGDRVWDAIANASSLKARTDVALVTQLTARSRPADALRPDRLSSRTDPRRRLYVGPSRRAAADRHCRKGLAARHTAGTRHDLPGIGKATAGVITEALDGAAHLPASLQESAGGPLVEGGEGLYAALSPATATATRTGRTG